MAAIAPIGCSVSVEIASPIAASAAIAPATYRVTKTSLSSPAPSEMVVPDSSVTGPTGNSAEPTASEAAVIAYTMPVWTALLAWPLLGERLTPLRVLAHTVERFGRGDFSARTGSRRRDEIGDLARAFDQMAGRIETLLTAERRLLQDISHELRSPLARLSFAAELTKTADDRPAAAARMKKEIDRLTDLVGALLQVTRVEGDPSSRSLERLDLDQLARELLEDSRVEADARGCRLHLESDCESRGILQVSGDRELLRRAIENVLRNAIRHAPSGSSIDVQLEHITGKALISVRDYGPGVPREMLPKIFQPFFRVDDSRDSQTGGVGLGLAIAHRAVMAHRGRLTAENATPGLRVRLELPLDSD